MHLDSESLHDLSRLARTAALRAGRLIAKRRGVSENPGTKSSGSGAASRIVTETDRASQRLILATLKPSLARFDLGLLAEETADEGSRFHKDHFWCVDPLDGTLPFSEGKTGFAVSIALVSRTGRPLLGAIFDPAGGDLYSATYNRGALKNRRPFRVQAPSPGHFNLVVDRSFNEHPHCERRLSDIRNLLIKNNYPEPRVVQAGGAVMNACHVLEHPPACYLKFPRIEQGGGSLWDFAAPAALFEECGARATDISGGALDLNRHDSTYLNHRGILFASDSNITSLFANASWS